MTNRTTESSRALSETSAPSTRSAIRKCPTKPIRSMRPGTALKRQFYRFDGDELRIRFSHATARHAPEYLRSSAVFDCAWARSISSSI